MSEPLRPDICVIGAGDGGLSVAIGASAFGTSVVLVERDRPGGNRLGSVMPAIGLSAIAARAEAFRTASPFGIGGAEPEIDFKRVKNHVLEVVDQLKRNDAEERLAALGIRFIRASGQFADRQTLLAGDVPIMARRFVIATGASVPAPPVAGIETVPRLNYGDMLGIGQRPRHLVVLGFEPTGLALAQAFRRLGSGVTVIAAGRILDAFDAEAAAAVSRALRREGIDLREGARLTAAARRGAHGVRLTVEEAAGTATIDASHLLLAEAPRPETEALMLHKAGIAHGPDGIGVNRGLRTSNRHVFAIGGVVPGHGSIQRSELHAALVLRAILFRQPVDIGRSPAPLAAFTDPEIAQVGLDEAAARRRGAIRVLRWPYSESDRARLDGRTDGFAKVITDRRGVILGATIVGAAASEQIALWSLAVARRMTVADVADAAFASPTFSEIGKRAAIAYFGRFARQPRGFLGLLRLLG
jgi:pyruvate/2-oxoglutarate dehydrogenase complex dihydrolipoamide dehydrogenase (E3) component